MPTQIEVSCARSRVTYAAGNRRLDNIFSIPYRIPLLNLLSHQHLLHYHSLLVFPHALTSAFFSFYFHYPMASSIPLYQPTNTLFSKTQVPISFLFSHPFCVSSICTSYQHCFLSEQFKGSRRGFLWKPSYSFGSRAENRARPIRASVGAPPFPLFQPPQVEETTSSEVNSTFLVFFLFVPRLFACWLLF